MTADGGVRPHNPQGRARHRAAPAAAPCLAVTAPKAAERLQQAPGPAERSDAAALQLPALKQSAFPTSGTFRLRAGRFLPVSPRREPRISAPNPFAPQRRPPRPAPRGAAAPRAARRGLRDPPKPPAAARSGPRRLTYCCRRRSRPALPDVSPPRCAAPAAPGPARPRSPHRPSPGLAAGCRPPQRVHSAAVLARNALPGLKEHARCH